MNTHTLTLAHECTLFSLQPVSLALKNAVLLALLCKLNAKGGALAAQAIQLPLEGGVGC